MRTDLFRISLAILLVALGANVLAHQAGHGPKISGKGPGGGTLVAVVSAKDADLGEGAKPIAVAEWFKTEKSFEARLWDTKLKVALPLTPKSEVKWIVIRKHPAKPDVIKQTVGTLSHTIRQEFSAGVLAGAEAIEVILPAREGESQKQVFSVPLN